MRVDVDENTKLYFRP